MEYVNPVANRLLLDSDSTVKIHAEGLFEEGKQRLRHMLATEYGSFRYSYYM